MTARQPLPLPESVGPEMEPYHVYARREILGVLRDLQNGSATLTVHYHRGEQFLVTRLLAINPEFEELIFDGARDEAQSKKLVASQRLVIVGASRGVKVQWIAEHVESVVFDNLPAFRLRLPDSILRLQRREYYRVETPIAKPLICRIPMGAGEAVQARVLDLSCGGLSCLVRDKELRIEVGQEFKNCIVELPEEGKVSTTLEVRGVSEEGEARRIRCKFRGMPGTMVTQVQRYIHRLERERLTATH